MATFGLYSAGGFARENKRNLCEEMNETCDEVVFIDDDDALWGTKINGTKVISIEEFLELGGKKAACVAFADVNLRKQKVFLLEKHGVDFFSFVAPTAIIGDNVRLGAGSILAEQTIITSDAEIGNHFHAGVFSYVSHDCSIGDYVTLATRASINGRVRLENEVYVGSCAVILPGDTDKPLTVGQGATIGAGAVVTKDVAPYSVVVGVPARPIQEGSVPISVYT